MSVAGSSWGMLLLLAAAAWFLGVVPVAAFLEQRSHKRSERTVDVRALAFTGRKKSPVPDEEP